MKAARLEAIGGFVVREVEKPVPGPDDLLVRVEAAGIGCRAVPLWMTDHDATADMAAAALDLAGVVLP